jgi:hypothetical protein
MTNCYGGPTGTDNFGTVSAKAGTWLGSFYATANGQTMMQFAPTPANGGTDNKLALCNPYNMIYLRSMSQDATDWTYGTATWRPAHNSTANRISYLDCWPGGGKQASATSIDAEQLVDVIGREAGLPSTTRSRSGTPPSNRRQERPAQRGKRAGRSVSREQLGRVCDSAISA